MYRQKERRTRTSYLLFEGGHTDRSPGNKGTDVDIFIYDRPYTRSRCRRALVLVHSVSLHLLACPDHDMPEFVRSRL